MLQVRKVRVEDVKLSRADTPATDGSYVKGEGVRLKAAGGNHYPGDGGLDPEMANWASVHMNLNTKDSQPPGKELLLALLDRPKTEEFMSAYGGAYGPCRVNLPEDSVFSFTVGANEGPPVEVKFQGNQAQVFVRALLYHWFVYEEETPTSEAD